MFWRFFSLMLCQVVAAGVGWFTAPQGDELTATLGMTLVGGYLWFLVDAARGLRLVRWLREGALSDLLAANPEVSRLLKPKELAKLFDLGSAFRSHTDALRRGLAHACTW